MRRLVILFCLACLSLPVYAQADALPLVWLTSAMQRVGLSDAANGVSSLTLYAAGNEYEAAQIVVTAAHGDLSHVQFRWDTPLTAATGAVIAPEQVDLYREQYRYLPPEQASYDGADLTNHPGGPGWYADGLIPTRDPSTGAAPQPAALHALPFDLTHGQNQPLWVDVFVAADAESGDYAARFTITSDQGEATGELRLHVWNFTLPSTPSEYSHMAMWYSDSPENRAELLRHHIMPHLTPPDEAHELVAKGLNAVGLGYWAGVNYEQCSNGQPTMPTPPALEELQARVAAYPPNLLLYNFTVDEVNNCADRLAPQMAEWAQRLHGAGIANFVTMSPVDAFRDDGTGRSMVDNWLVLPMMAEDERAAVQAAQARGEQVWVYNALAQDSYSPKWLLDYAPINFRILPGFLNQTQGFTGFQYWLIDGYNPEAWNTVTGFCDTTDWCHDFAYDFPDDGVLVYPGEPVGIRTFAPSMRLKWIRDGVEDFEYVAILKRRGLGEQALALLQPIAQDYRHWSQDAAEHEFVRRQLAALIEAAGG